jgi:hypothetical protein
VELDQVPAAFETDKKTGSEWSREPWYFESLCIHSETILNVLFLYIIHLHYVLNVWVTLQKWAGQFFVVIYLAIRQQTCRPSECVTSAYKQL